MVYIVATIALARSTGAWRKVAYVAVIIELNGSGEPFGHGNEETHDLMVSLGFAPIAYDPATRSATVLPTFNREGGNTIYIKNLEDINLRCAKAPRALIHTADGLQL